ncbi:hypothetical protein [Lysinibacillus fusiformis]|uniref:hypothetical protein n=1 Tax=Lysinibacillus fusiformis TaxID=28031 RepID=UPI0030195513
MSDIKNGRSDSMEKFIEMIKYGIDNNKPIEYFYEIYNDSWHLVRWNAMSIENEKFYRARTLNKEDLFYNINELKYPPSSIVSEKGRLNDINESVAYLSTSELVPLVELDINYYQIYCLVEIEYIVQNIIFFTIGIKGEYEGITEDEIKFIDFFNHLLTTPIKNYYNATIAFAKKIFKSGLFMNEVKLNQGIIYNSAQEFKTNKHLYNVVVEPKVFDECFRIKKATFQILSYNALEDCIITNEINHGKILDNGEINWEKSYEEMIKYCMDLYKGDIFKMNDNENQSFIVKYPEGIKIIENEDEDFYYIKINEEHVMKVEKANVIDIAN